MVVGEAVSRLLGDVRLPPGVEDVSKLFGDDVLSQAGLRSAVVGAKAASEFAANVGEDTGLQEVDLSAAFDGSTEGMQAKILAPRQYAQSPELFTTIGGVKTPFLQVGTFLGLGPEWLQIAFDVALDPLTYLSGGVGTLSKTGRIASAISTVTAGGKVANGAAVIDKFTEAIELGAKVAGLGVGDALTVAARAGDQKAIRQILRQASKAGDLSDEAVETIGLLKKNRKAFGEVLEATSEITAIDDLTRAPSLFLQPTVREQFLAGQRAFPSFRFPNPRDITRDPLKFTKNIFGFGFGSQRGWVPAGETLASGLDQVRKLANTNVPLLDEELRIGPRIDQLRSALNARRSTPGTNSAFETVAALEPLATINSMPTEAVQAALGLEPVTTSQMFAQFKQAKGIPGARSISDLSPQQAQAFQRFQDDAVKKATEQMRAFDKSVQAARDEAVSQMEERLTAAGASSGVADDVVQARISQNRRIIDAWSIESLAQQGQSMGLGLAGRANLGTLLASNYLHVQRDVFKRLYGSRAAVPFSGAQRVGKQTLNELVDESYPLLIEHPELFRFEGGRPYRGKAFLRSDLKSGDVAKESAALTDLLSRSDAEGSGLRQLLSEEGLPEEVVLIAETQRNTLDAIGDNLVLNEGILRDTIRGYFPRVFTPNKTFYKRFQVDRRASSALGDAIWDGKGQMSTILKKAQMESLESADKALRQGKLTFREARQLTEEIALELEKAGLGTIERSGAARFANYLDETNKSLLLNRLQRDLPTISPHMTLSVLDQADVDRLGLTAADVQSHRMVELDLPKDSKVSSLYREIDLLPTTPIAGRDAARALEVATAEQAARVAADFPDVAVTVTPRAARQQMLRDWYGKTGLETDLGRLDLIDARTGEPWKGGLRASWFKKGFPQNLRARATQGGKQVTLSPKSTRSRLKAALRREEAAAKKIADKATRRQADAVKRFEKAEQRLSDVRARQPQPTSGKVYVYKDWYPHLQETFRLWAKDRNVGTLTRWYDNFNYGVKSVVLLGDVFHYNVLALGSLASDPARMLGLLKDDLTGEFLPGVREGAGVGSALSRAPGVASTLGGAVGGAVAGAGLDEGDPSSILAGSIVGAMYGGAIGAARINAEAARRFFVNPDQLDTLTWMGLGGWTGRPDDRAIGMVNRKLDQWSRELAGKTRLSSPLTAAKHVTQAWDQVLWEGMHNGSKHAFFGNMWARELPRLQKSNRFSVEALTKRFQESGGRRTGRLTELEQTLIQDVTVENPQLRKFIASERFEMQRELASEIMQVSNNAFGGQRFANLFANPEIQFALRRFLLSPDWTSSRLALAANFFATMDPMKSVFLGAGGGALLEMAEHGFETDSAPWRGVVFGGGLGAIGSAWSRRIARRMRTPGDQLAATSRRMMSAALLGGFVFSNLANYGFTGHWMHENEEGNKLSIELPGRDPLGRTRFVHLGKPWLEAFEVAGFLDAEKFPIPVVSRLSSKAAAPVKFGLNVLTNQSGYGQIVTGDQEPWEVGYSLARYTLGAITPIIASGPVTAALEAGSEALGAGPRSVTATEAGIRFAGLPVRKSRTRGLVAAPGTVDAFFSPPSPFETATTGF